jgi:hypothetical protein
MLSSPVIDVVVGLVFFFFVLSLLVSAIQERVSAAIGMRSRDLERWIVKNLGADTAAKFYAHPLIASLGGAKASYIPSQAFAMALFDTVGATPAPSTAVGPADIDPLKIQVITGAARKPLEGVQDDALRATLLSHFDHAQGDLVAARSSVEGWFDNAMDRVSGAYKRRVHWYVIGIATAVALIINADTLRVARGLYQNPVVREAFSERARKVGANPQSTQAPDVNKLVADLPLPLGWTGDAPPSDSRDLAWFLLVKAIGVLLTVAAISLGAPFWFDLLNRIVNLRAAGNAPAPSAPAASTTTTTTVVATR